MVEPSLAPLYLPRAFLSITSPVYQSRHLALALFPRHQLVPHRVKMIIPVPSAEFLVQELLKFRYHKSLLLVASQPRPCQRDAVPNDAPLQP